MYIKEIPTPYEYKSKRYRKSYMEAYGKLMEPVHGKPHQPIEGHENCEHTKQSKLIKPL